MAKPNKKLLGRSLCLEDQRQRLDTLCMWKFLRAHALWLLRLVFDTAALLSVVT